MTTVAVTNYASLSTAINDFTERAYDSGQLDRIIGLAESAIRIYLGPAFAKDASATLTFTAGSAPQPTGFIRPIALTHLTYGEIKGASIGTIRADRVAANAVPSLFAVAGSTIEINISSNDSALLDYEGSLTGLSGSNATNWLIATAPHIYLEACLAVERLLTEDIPDFGAIQAAVEKAITDFDMQAVVGQFGRSGASISGSTP